MRLAERIRSTKVNKSEVVLFYLAQAGFCIKTAGNKILVIDAYLSDACERLFNFKRMIPSVIKAEELDADLYLSTHEHTDHLDPDSIPIIAKNKKTIFLGSPDCEGLYKQNDISKDRYIILKEGQQWETEGIKIRAVYADHGDLSPLGVGLLIDIEGIKIYHTGDTRFKPNEINASLKTEVDIMMAPINGQFENMNAVEACKLSLKLKPKIVIPIHFWMFVEHASIEGKGDPVTFLKESTTLPREIKVKVMAPGEIFRYPSTII